MAEDSIASRLPKRKASNLQSKSVADHDDTEAPASKKSKIEKRGHTKAKQDAEMKVDSAAEVKKVANVEIAFLADRTQHTPTLSKWLFDQFPYAFEEYGMHTLEDSVTWYRTCEVKDKMPMQFVAVNADTDELLGTAGLDLDDMKTGKYAKEGPWMVSVIVAPQFRMQGIASKLIKRCMEYARDHFKVKKLWLWTPDKAVSEMYAKLGWKLLERMPFLGKDISVMTWTPE